MKDMLCSEAMMLGSTMIKLDAGLWLNYPRSTRGCLIGMAVVAGNMAREDCSVEAAAVKKWPWLEKRLVCPDMGEPTYYGSRQKLGATSIISELARRVQNKSITLEQAVDWVRQQETVKQVKAVTPRKTRKRSLETPVEV